MLVNGTKYLVHFDTQEGQSEFVHRGVRHATAREQTVCQIRAEDGSLVATATVTRNHRDPNNLRVARKKAYAAAVNDSGWDRETRGEFLAAFFARK